VPLTSSARQIYLSKRTPAVPVEELSTASLAKCKANALVLLSQKATFGGL